MSQTKNFEEERESNITTEELEAIPKECFKEIKSNLSIIVDTLIKFNDTFNDLKEQTAAKTAQSLDTNLEVLDDTLGQIMGFLRKSAYQEMKQR